MWLPSLGECSDALGTPIHHVWSPRKLHMEQGEQTLRVTSFEELLIMLQLEPCGQAQGRARQTTEGFLEPKLPAPANLCFIFRGS